ncbi:hypothetical protein [Rhodococcus jostii]|uniref:hypothetical protein n=1 Tax=Rhodococcus jostii TaxID=132919 RepID=UPI00362E3BF2
MNGSLAASDAPEPPLPGGNDPGIRPSLGGVGRLALDAVSAVGTLTLLGLWAAGAYARKVLS